MLSKYFKYIFPGGGGENFSRERFAAP